MATKTSPQVAAGVQPKGLRVGLVAVTGIYSMNTTSLSAGDVIQMVKVPANATPVYVAVSGGNGAITIDVGDGIDDDRYCADLSASTGMTLKTINTVFVPYTYSTDDTIDITVSAVSVTTTGGAFNMVAIFSMNP